MLLSLRQKRRWGIRLSQDVLTTYLRAKFNEHGTKEYERQRPKLYRNNGIMELDSVYSFRINIMTTIIRM